MSKNHLPRIIVALLALALVSGGVWCINRVSVINTDTFAPDEGYTLDYQSPEVNSRREENEYLAAISDAEDYITELEHTGRTLLVIKNSPDEENAEYRTLMDALRRVGVPVEALPENANDAFLVADTELDRQPPAKATVEGETVRFTLDDEELVVNFENQDVNHAGQKLTSFASGTLTLIVYDSQLHEPADIVTITPETAHTLTRTPQ